MSENGNPGSSSQRRPSVFWSLIDLIILAFWKLLALVWLLLWGLIRGIGQIIAGIWKACGEIKPLQWLWRPFDQLFKGGCKLILVIWLVPGSILVGTARCLNRSTVGRRFFVLVLFILLGCWYWFYGPQLIYGSWYPYQHGIASHYDRGFYFKRTASSEWFLPGPWYTAAHKELPLGTRVLVVNQENQRRLVLRINDRGPFVEGRVIDLSRAAAHWLGIVDDGTAEVIIYTRERLREEPGEVLRIMPFSSSGVARPADKTKESIEDEVETEIGAETEKTPVVTKNTVQKKDVPPAVFSEAPGRWSETLDDDSAKAMPKLRKDLPKVPVEKKVQTPPVVAPPPSVKKAPPPPVKPKTAVRETKTLPPPVAAAPKASAPASSSHLELQDPVVVSDRKR